MMCASNGVHCWWERLLQLNQLFAAGTQQFGQYVAAMVNHQSWQHVVCTEQLRGSVSASIVLLQLLQQKQFKAANGMDT
jgi:hypothetical protein